MVERGAPEAVAHRVSSLPDDLAFAFTAKLTYDTSATPRARGTVLPIPAEIARAVPTRPDRTRRVNVAAGELPVYQAKVAGDGRGGFFVPVNRERRERLDDAYGEGREIPVTLTPDTSKYGLPVPAEFDLLLADDGLAASHFDALPGGTQRRILFGLNAPKRESTRLHRAVATAEYLTEVRGEVDLRELAARWRLPRV